MLTHYYNISFGDVCKKEKERREDRGGYVYMMQLCGQFIMLVLLVNLLHAIIGVLKLSLVLHDMTASLRFY